MNRHARIPPGRRGGTLTELMVAVAILSIGVLGLFGAFKFIGRTIFISRASSLATNLGQERIESLKNLSYFALQITTATADIPGFSSPNIPYDTANYPPETIQIGGITFTRYTYVAMAQMSGSDIGTVSFTYPDTGLKQINVHVVWTENNVRKKWSLRNLLENPNVNPLDSTVSGTVTGPSGAVARALVVVEQNEDWGATADNSGNFSFAVYHGTYTLRASSAGFNDGVSSSFVASRGATTNVPITLSQVATGYLYGTLWYNNYPVISQIVASTVTEVATGGTADVEYVELYNPTTYAFNVGNTGDGQKTLMFAYNDEDGNYRYDSSWYAPGNDWNMVNVTTYIAPGRYYLIANASSFCIAGQWKNADAYYRSDLSYPNYILNDKAINIAIYSWNLGQWLDYVGIADNNDTIWGEGVIIPDAGGANDGLGTPSGKQVVRISSPGINVTNLPNYGRAYDSNWNVRDFLYESGSFTGFQIPPKNHADGQHVTLTGKVPSNAYVSASDPNSGSTITFTSYITSGALQVPYNRFQLHGVSTGTWSATASYLNYIAFIDTLTVTQNVMTGVPTATSNPAWSGVGLHHFQLYDTSATSGFVKGVVTNESNQPIANITIQGGGATKVTGSNGVYFMTVSTGTVTVVYNPNNSNANYIQEIKMPSVTAGAVTTQDVILRPGGRITGYVTTGTTPLANQPIAVTLGGSQAGAGVTDAGGNFSIRNVSTGTYTVFPVLESGQDVVPNTLPAVLSSSGTVFVGTFTVNGAFGSISGTVSDASGLITSGALLLASTNSIAASPSAIVGSSAPSQVPLYMVSSKADGTYNLPVRGGATYYLSAYVPVISPSGTVTITTKTYSGIVVTPSVATSKTVTIP